MAEKENEHFHDKYILSQNKTHVDLVLEATYKSTPFYTN
jgi:hypothetical protein